MRRKTCLFTIVLMTLAALISFASLFVRNAICKLAPPEVDVIPSEAYVGQQVVVEAKINVMTCWGDYDVRDMQASLIFPPEGNLISGDNPVYIGNVNRGESRTVNWTLTFTASGVFNVDVNASGYRQDTGEYVEKHGYATVTVVDTPAAVGGISIPVDKLGLLAPYIDVASTIAAATVVTAIYVKCIRRRKKRR